jgi:hypothetical protein
MMTNEGTMTLSDTSLLAVTGSFNNYAKLYMIGQAVLQNNGRVMNSSTNTPKTALLDNNATFINTGDFTNNAPFYNRNSFQNQQAGTVYLIDLFDSPGNVINYGAFVNTDSLVIRGRFDNNAGGRLSNSRNYIIIMNSGLLSNTPNGIVINGIGLTVASEKALAPLQYSYLINYGGFSNGGYLTNNSTMINQNFFDNYSPGRNPMNTDSYFTNNSQFTNTGRINNLGFIINSGFGVIQHNAKVFNNIFVIRNNGRLTIASDATFAISAGFCTNGYLIDNQGTMTCANQLILVNYFAASILGFSGPYLNYKVTTQPSNVTVPTNGTAAFTVATSGTQVAYQWQVSTDQGFTWTDLTNGSNYSGVTTASLRITNTPGSFNNYMYRAHVTGPQTGNDGDSDRATLTVSGNLKPFALKQ